MKVGDTVVILKSIPFYGIRDNEPCEISIIYSWEHSRGHRLQIEDGFDAEVYIPHIDDTIPVSFNELRELTLLEKALDED